MPSIKRLAAARKKDPKKFNRVYNKARRGAAVSKFSDVVTDNRTGQRTNRLTKKAQERHKIRGKRLHRLSRAAGATAASVKHLKG